MSKKIYEKEKVVKFLDLIIRDVENVECFNIKEDINKYRDIDDHEKAYLPHSIESLGKTYEIFENTLKSEEWFKLTAKGIDLKEYDKGLNKFERKLKRKFSPFEKISVLFFVIGFLLGGYQNHLNNSLENRVSNLENQRLNYSIEIDFLKTELQLQKSHYDKLSRQYDSLSVEFIRYLRK
jgi:hypothetical protein